MSIIGDATIAVEADTRGFSAEVEDQVNKTAKKAASLFAGAFSLREVFRFGADALDDFREAERIGRLTTQVIESTGGAAHVTTAQMGDLASRLSEVAAVDDDLVQAAGNVLLTFTKVRNEVGEGNNIFDQGAEAALNMSAALGTDLQAATIQIGKSLNDPIKGITALSEAGVSFTEQQKEQIRTMVQSGDILSAQKIILNELGTEFGGAAQAAADPLDRLAVIVGNVKERIGGELAPVINDIAREVEDALPEFESLASRALPALASGVKAAIPVGKSFLDILVALVPVIEVAADVVAAMPPELLRGATAFGVLGTGLGPFPNLFKQFSAGAKEGSGALGSMKSGIGALNPWVLAGTVALTAFTSIMASNAEEQRRQEQALQDTTAAFQDQTTAIRDDLSALAQANLETKHQVDDLARLGVTYEDFATAARGGTEAQTEFIRGMIESGEIRVDQRVGIKTLNDALEQYGSIQGAVNSGVLRGNDGLIRSLLDLEQQYQAGAKATLDDLVASETLTAAKVAESEAHHRAADGTTDYLGVLQEVQPEAAKAAEGADTLTTATGDTTDALADQETQIKQTLDALTKFLNEQIAGADAQIGYEQSLDDLTDSIKENGTTLDINTQKGRDNIGALRDTRQAIIDVAQQRYEETGSADEAAAAVSGMTDRLADELRQRGLSEGKIMEYIAALDLTPDEVRTQLIVNADEAAEQLRGFSTLCKVIGADAAKQFVDGIVDGFRDSTGRVVGSADSIARTIETTVNRRLEIRSPSGVAKRIGGFFMDGLRDGLVAGTPDVQAYLTAVTTNIVNGAQTALGAIKTLNGLTGAREGLGDAQSELDAARKRQDALPELIASAARQVRARADQAEEITPAERLAILRAQQDVIDKTDDLRKMREEGTATALELKIASAELDEAEAQLTQTTKDATGPTDELNDAIERQKALRDEQTEVAARVEAAERAVRDATEGVVAAQAAAIETSARLAGDTQLVDWFTQVATSAGLTKDAIAEMLDELEEVGGAVGGSAPGMNVRAGSSGSASMRDRLGAIAKFVGESWSGDKFTQILTQIEKGQRDLAGVVRDVENRTGKDIPDVIYASIDTPALLQRMNIAAAVGSAVQGRQRLHPLTP